MTPEQQNYEGSRLAYFAAVGADVIPGRTTDRRGREIYWLERPGKGRPIVLVHGGGASASVWAPFVAALSAETDRPIVALDRPGCGLTFTVTYGDGDYREQAADFIEDVATALGGPCDFVANSMGGFFVLALALRRPELVASISLLGVAAGLDRWLPGPLRFMALRPVQWLIQRGKPMDVDGLRKLHGDILVAHPERLRLDYLETEVMPLEGNFPSFLSLLRVVANLRGSTDAIYIRDEVASLDLPVLIVVGDRDVFAPVSSSEALVAQMPRAELVVVRDAGHLPWLDECDACIAATRDFLFKEGRSRAAA